MMQSLSHQLSCSEKICRRMTIFNIVPYSPKIQERKEWRCVSTRLLDVIVYNDHWITLTQDSCDRFPTDLVAMCSMRWHIRMRQDSEWAHSVGLRYILLLEPTVDTLHVHLVLLWDKMVDSCPTWSVDSLNTPYPLPPILYNWCFRPAHTHLGKTKQANWEI